MYPGGMDFWKNNCVSAAAMPALAKQYRETIREIDELEGAQDHGDEIGEMLAQREAHGKPGAVRADRTDRKSVV